MRLDVHAAVAVTAMLLLEAGTMAATPLIRHIAMSVEKVAVGQQCSIVADLAASPKNPDDPGELEVWGEFVGPGDRKLVIPGFYYRHYRIDASAKAVVPTGETDWRVRFTPITSGAWTAVLHVRTAVGVERSSPMEILATAPSDGYRGFVTVDPENPRHLRYGATGVAFYAFGANLFERILPIGPVPTDEIDPKKGLTPQHLYTVLTRMEAKLDELARLGGTFYRLRADGWWLGLEAPERWLPGCPEGVPGYAIGRYHPGVAWVLDRLLERSQTLGLHAQVCTWPGNTIRHWGRLAKAEGLNSKDYLPYASLPENGELAKRRLRYQVARFGAFTSVAAWEYFNEIGHGWNQTTYFDVNNAHWRGITEYLRSIDPYDHLVTNSAEGIDTRDLHAYIQNGNFFTWTRRGEMRRTFAQFREQETRPFILGEYGINRGQDATLQQHVAREGLWCGLASGKAGALTWYTFGGAKNSLFDENARRSLYAPMAAFLNGENLTLKWRPAELVLEPEQGLLATGMIGDRQRAIIYVVRTPSNEKADRKPLDGAAIRITGLADGTYRAQWWNVQESGAVTGASSTHRVTRAPLRVPLPAGVTRDVALKVAPTSGEDP